MPDTWERHDRSPKDCGIGTVGGRPGLHPAERVAGAGGAPRIARHYGELEDITGSPVVRLNRAVAVAEADGPLAGLALLDGLDLSGHRLPAVRGQLLLRLGRDEEGRAELRRAVDACGNEAERAGLRRLLDETSDQSG